MNKQEPTNKELLKMIAMLTELAVLATTETRTYWQTLVDTPKTDQERIKRATEIETLTRRINKLGDEVQDLVLEHKDLLDLEIKED